MLSDGPSYPHIQTEACDTPAHRQTEAQRFGYDASTKRITLLPGPHDAAGDAADQCLTIGQDKDPDSGTKAVELQACDDGKDAAQQWALQPSGQISSVASAGKTCLDQDVSVHRVITYGCHAASAPGNQAWRLDNATAHVVSVQNGLCMAVLPATAP